MVTRWNKIWVVVTLCSLLVYQVRWLYGILGVIYDGLTSQDPVGFVFRLHFWADYVLNGLVGNGFRILAVALALFVVYLAWGREQKSFLGIRTKLSWAVAFEGIYFLALLPITVLILLRWNRSPVLMAAYVVQILLVAPLLMFLGLKVRRSNDASDGNLLKWMCFAGLGYLVGIWLNNIFRWLDMATVAGMDFLFSGLTSFGFLSALVTLSISLVFASGGIYVLLRKMNRTLSIRLFGIALIALGLHFVIFILYSVVSNSLGFVWLTEIWPVTALGLGIGFLKGRL